MAIGITRHIRTIAVSLLLAAGLPAHAQTTWHWAGPTPQGNALRGVIWHSGEFVAVGENGTIITSLDRIDWELQSSGTRNTLASILWQGHEFVAAGENGAVLTSPDWLRRKRMSALSLAFMPHLAPIHVGQQRWRISALLCVLRKTRRAADAGWHIRALREQPAPLLIRPSGSPPVSFRYCAVPASA